MSEPGVFTSCFVKRVNTACDELLAKKRVEKELAALQAFKQEMYDINLKNLREIINNEYDQVREMIRTVEVLGNTTKDLEMKQSLEKFKGWLEQRAQHLHLI